MSPSPSRPEFLAQNRIPRDCVMQNNGVADSRRTHYSAHKLDILARVCIASEEKKEEKKIVGKVGRESLHRLLLRKLGQNPTGSSGGRCTQDIRRRNSSILIVFIRGYLGVLFLHFRRLSARRGTRKCSFMWCNYGRGKLLAVCLKGKPHS